MKNMKKLLRKAMVFTLTAAMLVGTPLTASAAGILDLYTAEDGAEAGLNNSNSNSNSDTGSGVLDEMPADLLGIFLDNNSLEVEHPATGSLTAELDWSGGKVPAPADLEKIVKTIQWESDNPDVIAVETKEHSGEGNGTSTVTLKPTLPGTATVTASLSSKDGKSFFAKATVTVIRYADALEFRKDEMQAEAYTGNTIDLDYFVDRYLDGKVVDYTSDTLAFSYKLDESNANENCATLKNGVLTLKKTGNVKVLAVGQKKISTKEGRVGTGWCPLTIGTGNNAKKIEFNVGTSSDYVKNATLKVNEDLKLDVTAVVTKKDDDSEDCTNRISWLSKNPELVAITTSPTENVKLTQNKCKVTLMAQRGSAGKTVQIVAKASNGKSATLKVKVSADLTKIEIANAPKTAYSGQTIDLYDAAVQSFGKKLGDAGNEGFTDAGLKWSFDATGKDLKDMKSAASINAKGVLTVKPDLTKAKVKTVKVTVQSAKKVNGKFVPAKEAVTIDLKQVDITSISVVREKELASAKLNDAKTKVSTQKGNDTIDAGKKIVYTLDVKGKVDDNGTMKDLSPEEARAVVGWTASGNGKIVKASKNADNNGVVEAIKKGKATITINAATQKKNGKYVPIKTTLTDKVNAPTKTLALSVKKLGVAEGTKKAQTITVTPVIDKGSTTDKKKDIKWTATLKKSDGTIISNLTATNGKVKLLKDGYEAGNVVVVNARTNGLSKTIELPIVKSGSVKFVDKDNKPIKSVPLAMSDEDVDKDEFNTTVYVTVGGATPDKDNVSPVTYTVNKPGIVRIKDLRNGELQINAVTNGTVKITATTLDGKKANLTVKVSKVTYAAKFWKQNQ